MPKQNQPAPKQGSFRRNRASTKGAATSKSGSIVGKITQALWGKKKGWHNPGR